MCPSDNDEFTTDAPREPIETASKPQVESTPNQPWNRRSFLKAAALGATAAAFTKGGLTPRVALAHTDTKSACTANDIDVSNGTIINEPCSCTGAPFAPVVRFLVTNKNNAARKCITLHLDDAFGDVLLVDTPSGTGGSSSIAGLGTQKFMYAKLNTTIRCDTTKICFPTAVVAFQTAQNQSDAACSGPITKYPGGQCRRQEICVIGYGVELVCTAGCTPACGGTSTLQACVSGRAEQLPFTVVLTNDKNGSTQTATITSLTKTSPTDEGGTACVAFNVHVTDPHTTYTATVTDATTTKCQRTGKTLLSANPVKITSTSGTPPSCAGGKTTLSACASGGGSITYEFSENGTALCSNTSSTGCGSCQVLLSPGSHTITVKASSGACSDTTTFPVLVPQPLIADLSLTGHQSCDGKLTFTADVQGGTGPYTISFLVNGVEQQKGASTTFAYGPKLDGTCYTISVLANDNNTCPSSPSGSGKDTISVTQCVTTTTGC